MVFFSNKATYTPASTPVRGDLPNRGRAGKAALAPPLPGTAPSSSPVWNPDEFAPSTPAMGAQDAQSSQMSHLELHPLRMNPPEPWLLRRDNNQAPNGPLTRDPTARLYTDTETALDADHSESEMDVLRQYEGEAERAELARENMVSLISTYESHDGPEERDALPFFREALVQLNRRSRRARQEVDDHRWRMQRNRVWRRRSVMEVEAQTTGKGAVRPETGIEVEEEAK